MVTPILQLNFFSMQALEERARSESFEQMLPYALYAISKNCRQQICHNLARPAFDPVTEWMDRAISSVQRTLKDHETKAPTVVDLLACFLFALDEPSFDIASLQSAFLELPEPLQEKLSTFLGRECLLANPRALLEWQDDAGNNLLEVCIERLYQGSSLDEIDMTSFRLRSGSMEAKRKEEKEFRRVLILRNLSFFTTNIDKVASVGLRHQIAMCQMEREMGSFLEHVEKFSLEPVMQFEIAKICAKRDPRLVAENIHRFSLSDLEKKEIARICLQTKAAVAVCLPNFGLLKETRLQLFQELGTDYRFHPFMKFVPFFGLTEDQKKSLFPRLMETEPAQFVDVIESVPIELQETLARALMQERDRRSFWDALPNFLLSEEVRYALAVEIGADDANSVMHNIKNFRLESKEKRVALAKAIGETDPSAVANWFRDLDITREDDTDGAISKILFRASPSAFLDICDLWGVSQQERIEYLEGVFRVPRRDLSRGEQRELDWAISYFDKYGIADENARYQLFLQAVQSAPGVALSEFAQFRLEPRRHLEIALSCVEKWPSHLAQNISVFTLDAAERSRIAHLYIQHDESHPRQIDYIQHFGIRDKKEAMSLILQYAAKQKKLGRNEDDYRYVSWYQTIDPAGLERVQMAKKVAEQLGGEISSEVLQLFLDFIFYGNVGLAKYAVDTLILYVKRGYSVAAYKELYTNEKGEVLTFLKMPMLQIACWMAEGGKKDQVEIIRRCLRLYRKELKNGDPIKGLMQPWLYCMQGLSQINSLSSEEKLLLMTEALSIAPPELQKRISYIHMFCKMGWVDSLREAMKNIAELPNIMQKRLQEDPFFSKSVAVPGFVEKYEKTLALMRSRGAWVIYGLKIQEASEEVQDAFHAAIQSILRGTLSEDRYAVGEGREHLTRLKESLGEEKWALWQKEFISEPYEVNLNGKASLSFSFQKFLSSRYVEGHLSFRGHQLEHLSLFLQDPSVEKLAEYEEMRVKDLGNRVFAAEVQLMKWFLEGISLEAIVKQGELVFDIAGVLARYEIANDLLSLLRSHRKQTMIVQVVETDHWQDLFFCGTEVVGSCQRIDGDSHYNKCLLAYILDGKNRVLAVKDAESGRIHARAILRLLFCKGRPALFLEKLYPDPCPSGFQEEILAQAKQKARDLGVGLYRAGHGTDLESFRSSVPYEYVDASSGIEYWGEFTVSGEPIPL